MSISINSLALWQSYNHSWLIKYKYNETLYLSISVTALLYPPHNKVVVIPPTQQSCWGVYWFHSVRSSLRLSICPSVLPSVRPASHVRSVASTVQDRFFPYLVQMINSMRGCVPCDDTWSWPVSSRSFGLDLENCVRSVVSTILDRFFLYLAQMITDIRGCVTFYFFSESANFLNIST